MNDSPNPLQAQEHPIRYSSITQPVSWLAPWISKLYFLLGKVLGSLTLLETQGTGAKWQSWGSMLGSLGVPALERLPAKAKQSPLLTASVVLHVRILPARLWEGSW